ncbi:hypothetical protein PENTCL1PPCAC_30135, partial [Pristionchus entomophagus]
FLLIFDICSTIVVTVALLFTCLSAFFVYFKLLFYSPHSKNYTFKLISINGIAELMSCLTHLILYQLTSHPFMLGFYLYLRSLSTYSFVGFQEIFILMSPFIVDPFIDEANRHIRIQSFASR